MNTCRHVWTILCAGAVLIGCTLADGQVHGSTVREIIEG